MVFRLRSFTCRQCGVEFSGRFPARREFCSVRCRQAHRNDPARNPALSAESRAKRSEAMKGRQLSLGRVLSAETKARIARSLTGKRQPPDVVAKRREAWRNRWEQDGPSPAQLAHFEAMHPSGAAHPNWRGGTTPQRTQEFASPEYKAFHQAVMERDRWTCQHCGAKQGLGELVALEVHHVRSYAEHPDERFDPANGIVLCDPCHVAAHRGAPRPSRVDFQPKPRTCAHCGREYRVRNPRKYCPVCRAAICCPVCGSTKCAHWQRKALPYYSQPG